MARQRSLWLRRLLLLYLVVLGLSHLYRWALPPRADPPPGVVLQTVVIDRGGAQEAQPEQEPESIEIAYAHWRAGAPDSPWVLLLHGGVHTSEQWAPLRAHLGERYHLLVPDLPGFGASTYRLESYAPHAQARYLEAFLGGLEPELGQRPLHVVAYGENALTALHLHERLGSDARIASLSFLAASGVPEYQLFGHPEWNRYARYAEYALLWLLQEGVPHFGLLDHQPWPRGFTQGLVDRSVNAVRPQLAEVEVPVLWLHGLRDTIVPLEAAREHRRLVPQSRLEILDTGHALLTTSAPAIAGALEGFWDAVEAGEAPGRGAASAERLGEAQAAFERDPDWHYTGPALVLILLLLAVATLVSEDLSCIVAGLLVAHGLIGFQEAVLACFLGIFIGDLGLYCAGRFLGPEALRGMPLRWIVSEQALAKATLWFNKRGPIIIIASRFLPGTRAGIFFTAGAVRAHFGQFFLYFAAAAAVWTPLLVLLARWLGEGVLGHYEAFSGWAVPVMVAVGIALYLALHLGLPALSRRGRRLLLGAWRRRTRWEFWPLWLINAPVFLYVLYLVCLRYRRPTLFTVANPGIPHSGFIGESKSAILQGLRGAGTSVARWRLLERGQKGFGQLEAFLEEAGLGYPIVLKPDEGQRGLGVTIAKTPREASQALRRAAGPMIAQEYIAGEEFGVLYERMPGEAQGRVTSITTKRLIEVVGDGETSLEWLILNDARAVCLAPRFLARFQARLESIPAAGERIPLVEVGTHARGALFLDGNALWTPELEAAIERIARTFEGFHLGRFDLRVPSIDALRRGEDLRVIELNGLTAEPTHIYDPRHGLLYAWSRLMRHWRTAVEIGAANAQRGHQPMPLRVFLRTWRNAHQRQRRTALGERRTARHMKRAAGRG